MDAIIKLKAEIFDIMMQRDQAIAQAKQIDEKANAMIKEKLEEIQSIQASEDKLEDKEA